MTLTVVLGGQKSGKSSHAAALAAASGSPVVVVAPAEARDDAEFGRRIARHRQDRPADWETVETFDVAGAIRACAAQTTVVVDAMDTWFLQLCEDAGVWAASSASASGEDVAAQEKVVLEAVDEVADAAVAHRGDVIVIAGQPGNSMVAVDAGLRRYVDLHGLALQRLSAAAVSVELVVAGRVVALPPIAVSASRGGPGTSASVLVSSGGVGQPLRAAGSDSAAVHDLPTLLAAAVTPPDSDIIAAARGRVGELAIPPGSMGRLADLAVQLAAITGSIAPAAVSAPALLVFAGDHGVHARGVSAWPQALTAAVADVVAAGRSAAAVMAAELGAGTTVVDVGISAAVPAGSAVVGRRVRPGTDDITVTTAMTIADAERALGVGARAANDLIDAGADALLLGEVGIANTTVSAALIAAVTGAAPAVATGRGAGVDDDGLARKVAAVGAVLQRHAGSGLGDEPVTLLASLGGLEHAALTGAMLAAAARHVPVVLDGVTTLASALIAARLAPAVCGYLIAGHRSAEPGATVALEHLGLAPLLDLDMRLGEGAGAVTALPLLRAAAALITNTAALADL